MGNFGEFSINNYSYEYIQRGNGYYLPNSSLLCCVFTIILITFNKPIVDKPKQPFIVVVLV